MKLSRFALLFWGTLALMPSAFANDGVLEMQNLLEGRLRPIVKELDPKALVYVTVRTKSLEAELPSTPFMYRDYVLEGPEGEMLVERIDITIYSDAKEFPPALKKIVRELAGIFAPLTRLQFKALPQEFAAFATNLKANREIAQKPVEEKPADRSPAGETVFSRAWNWTTGSQGLPALAIFGALFFSIAFFFSVRALLRGARDVSNSVERGVDKMAKAFERAAQERTPVTVTTENAGTDNTFRDLSDDAWDALLTDCYWSSEDAYAAFLWARVPFGTRRKILERRGFLAQYAAYLPAMRPTNLGFDRDPYYVTPYPIGALDNESVAALVREAPALLLRLPPLRVANLPLTADERLALLEQAESRPTNGLPDFSSFPASRARDFARTLPLRQLGEGEERRVAEEVSIPSLTLVRSVPSLGWALRMSADDASKVFEGFTAEELATAWLGPEPMLLQLAKLLPNATARRLMELRSRVTPSRSSATFRALHQRLVERFRDAGTPQEFQVAA